MKKRILLMAALALPVIFLAVWAASVEYKIKHAQEITIRAEGFDPRSLISGHYLSLRLNWQETDCRQFSDNLCHPSRFQSVYNYYLPECLISGQGYPQGKFDVGTGFCLSGRQAAAFETSADKWAELGTMAETKP